MTFNYRRLSVMALLSSSTVFSMENTGALLLLTKERKVTFQFIVKSNKWFEDAVPKIKALAQDDQEWKQIFDCKFCAEKLINCVEKHDSYKALPAAFLGTPGAIIWGKEHIISNPNAKLILRVVLVNMARCEKEDCVWPYQDLDVAKAILDMGVEVMTTNKDLCQYNFPYDDTDKIQQAIRYGNKAGVYAIYHEKVKFIKLLAHYCVDTVRIA